MVKTPGVLVLDNQGHQQSTEMLKQWRQGWRERGPHSGPILSTKCLQAARDFAPCFHLFNCIPSLQSLLGAGV